jgi:hypothetical protein
MMVFFFQEASLTRVILRKEEEVMERGSINPSTCGGLHGEQERPID